MTPAQLRALSAAGKFDEPTAGYCPGFVQANLAAFPQEYAEDFEMFCRENPQPCPLLEVIGPASSISQKLAPGADIFDTIPRYLIWHKGVCSGEVQSIRPLAKEDMVFFLLGCSFSFEEALLENGIALRHLEEKKNVAMYKTNIPLVPAGVFEGEMVVSMRPIRGDQVELAKKTTSLYPEVHGAPVHSGNPARIGRGGAGFEIHRRRLLRRNLRLLVLGQLRGQREFESLVGPVDQFIR